jgi:hypothetical protein
LLDLVVAKIIGHARLHRAQEAPGLIDLLPRREPLGPVNTRELARLRIPGDEARDEEAGADVEEERAPGRLDHPRFTAIRPWALQVRTSVLSGWPTLPSMGELSACRRVRPADDLPLPGLVDETIRDL